MLHSGRRDQIQFWCHTLSFPRNECLSGDSPQALHSLISPWWPRFSELVPDQRNPLYHQHHLGSFYTRKCTGTTSEPLNQKPWVLNFWPSPKSLPKANAGQGAEKREPSSTIGGNVRWNNHYREQYGGSFKN